MQVRHGESRKKARVHGRTTTERNTNQTSLPSPSVDQRPSLVENEEKRTPASYVHCLESNAALKGIRALYDNKYECVCVGEHRKAMRTCVVTGVWICSFFAFFPFVEFATPADACFCCFCR